MSLSCTVSKILSVNSQNLQRLQDLEYIPFKVFCVAYYYSAVLISKPNLKCIAPPIPKIWLETQNLKIGHFTMIAPLSRDFVVRGLGIATMNLYLPTNQNCNLYLHRLRRYERRRKNVENGVIRIVRDHSR